MPLFRNRIAVLPFLYVRYLSVPVSHATEVDGNTTTPNIALGLRQTSDDHSDNADVTEQRGKIEIDPNGNGTEADFFLPFTARTERIFATTKFKNDNVRERDRVYLAITTKPQLQYSNTIT